jgi:surface antigen
MFGIVIFGALSLQCQSNKAATLKQKYLIMKKVFKPIILAAIALTMTIVSCEVKETMPSSKLETNPTEILSTPDESPEQNSVVADATANEKLRAAAAVSCQCVAYIRNRFSLQGYYGNAKDWHSNLIKAGWEVTAYPKYGNIIIFQPSFGGVDKTYGHIAAVESYSYSYNDKTKVGTRTLKHRGANTGGSSTEHGCNNVGNSSVTYTDSKVGSIAYYRKK